MDMLDSQKARYLLYGGAKGGGKSYLLRAREVIRRMQYPGTTGVIIRKTYDELYGNHIEKFFEEFPITKQWYKDKNKVITWPTKPYPSKTYFRYLENKNDVRRFQGIEYPDMSLDEALLARL